MADVESLARKAIERGLYIHRELGPGLLESIYEAVLATGLAREGFRVERQKVVPMRFEGITYPESFRLGPPDRRAVGHRSEVNRTEPADLFQAAADLPEAY